MKFRKNAAVVKAMCQLTTSALCFLAAYYCLLWMLASADLAFVACDGYYSLFHPHFRCKQPFLALFLSIGFGIACVSLLYFGWRSLKQRAVR